MTPSPRVLSECRGASDAGRISVGKPQERSFRCLGVLSARAGDAWEERTRGSAWHNYICVKGREEVANDHRVVPVAGGAGGSGRRAVVSVLTCTRPAVELDAMLWIASS